MSMKTVYTSILTSVNLHSTHHSSSTMQIVKVIFIKNYVCAWSDNTKNYAQLAYLMNQVQPITASHKINLRPILLWQWPAFLRQEWVPGDLVLQKVVTVKFGSLEVWTLWTKSTNEKRGCEEFYQGPVEWATAGGVLSCLRHQYSLDSACM